jgi:hypothetical protein
MERSSDPALAHPLPAVSLGRVLLVSLVLSGRGAAGGASSFSKRVPGDAYRVQLRAAAAAATRITVTLTASPD